MVTPIGFGVERNKASASVSLFSPVVGATIHYTTDGSDPTTESPVYTGSFELVGTKTIKALVVKEGLNNSAIAKLEITVVVPDIFLGTEDGTAVDNCKVVIANIEAYETFTDVVFRYTLDGTEPTESSPVMDGEIEITSNCTVKVKGFSDMFEDTDTASIAIDNLRVQDVVINGEQPLIMPDYLVETTDVPEVSIQGGMAYGDGTFVSIGDNYSKINYFYISNDGINWRKISQSGVIAYTRTVAYGNGIFLMTCEYRNRYYILRSIDGGENWERYTLSHSYTGNEDLIYVNGKFVIISTNSSIGLFSEDGINWSEIDCAIPVEGNTADMVYGNGKYVAIRKTYHNYSISEDGVNWTAIEESDTADGKRKQCIIFTFGKFILLVNKGIMYSEDGLNWEWAVEYYGYDNGSFVIVEDVLMLVFRSSRELKYKISYDGVNWSDDYSFNVGQVSSNARIMSVCYGSQRLVMSILNYTNGYHYRLFYSNKC